MPDATHATLASFRIDLANAEEQRRLLREMIVPGVRSFPGFVAGTWTLDRERSESAVMLTYESATAAEAMSTNIRGNAENQRAAGLELIELRVLEVQAVA